jgi:ribosomal protein S20
LAKTPRGWTGARTPSAIKRVRQAERRRAINQPRKSAAKTYAANAVRVATDGGSDAETAVALAEAMSALDRAAKVGAIHPNNAARRKSRLVLRLNAIAEGTAVQTTRVAKSTGTAAAVKAARSRIATAKATKAKGPQTAAGKAKAALSKSARAEAASAAAAEASKAAAKVEKPAPKAAAKTAAKAPAKAEKPVAKAAAKAPAKVEKPAPKAAAKTPAKVEKPAPKAEKKPKG